MRARIAWAVSALALTACTPSEIDAWLQWHAQDPVAAEAFANQPEIQALLHPPAPVSSNLARWDRIARCESGGRWDYPPVTNRTGTYSGGLMIWTKAWVVYGGQQFAPQAWLATKAQQIVVAERIWADNGPGAWDCK